MSTAALPRQADSIDPSIETLIPLKSPSQIGARVTCKTLRLYADEGCRSRVNGLRIFLATIFEGHVRCTSREAYCRFIMALNAPPEPAKARRR